VFKLKIGVQKCIALCLDEALNLSLFAIVFVLHALGVQMDVQSASDPLLADAGADVAKLMLQKKTVAPRCTTWAPGRNGCEA
jgi:hypothetical protein